MAAARNTLGALRLKQGDVAERRTRRSAPRCNRSRTSGSRTSTWRSSPSSAATPTGAIAEYRKEIELHPGSYMAQFNLGKAYERLGRTDEQLAAFKSAIASNPEFAEGHLFLAKLELDKGQLDEAIRLARRGLELKPRGDVAPLGHFVLSDAYAREGRTADAAREAEEGRRLAGRARAR